MGHRKKEDYIFADAYIGSFVRNLMSKQDLIRLVQAKDIQSVQAILQEFGYGDAKELDGGDIEFFIRREQSKLFKLIYNSLPERSELSFMLLPYDYHNVKVCIKSELLGLTPDDNYLVSAGDIDWRKVVAMVRERNYISMSSKMKEAIEEAFDRFARSKDPQEIDIVLDTACYEEMLERVNELDNEYLIGLVKRQIDLINLKSFVRMRMLNKAWDFFKRIFLTGGEVPLDIYVSGYDDSYDQIAERLSPFGLDKVLIKGTERLKEDDDFSYLEKMADDHLMEYIKKAKYESFGIEPIVGYWMAKEEEIDNLRIILLGRRIGIGSDRIIERLREPYV